jgi:hypothetical protein
MVRKISIQDNDCQIQEWLHKQSNLSKSLGILIMREVQEEKSSKGELYDIGLQEDTERVLPTQAELTKVIPMLIKNHMIENDQQMIGLQEIYRLTMKHFSITNDVLEQFKDAKGENKFFKNIRFVMLTLKNFEVISNPRRGYYSIKNL